MSEVPPRRKLFGVLPDTRRSRALLGVVLVGVVVGSMALEGMGKDALLGAKLGYVEVGEGPETITGTLDEGSARVEFWTHISADLPPGDRYPQNDLTQWAPTFVWEIEAVQGSTHETVTCDIRSIRLFEYDQRSGNIGGGYRRSYTGALNDCSISLSPGEVTITVKRVWKDRPANVEWGRTALSARRVEG